MMTRILGIGDLHGAWPKLNAMLAAKKPALALQVGDLGFFPELYYQVHVDGGAKRVVASNLARKTSQHQYAYFSPTQLKTSGVAVHFCHGNHENLPALLSLENTEVAKNVRYQPSGSVLTLPDGRNVLFIGGAKSCPDNAAVRGVDWFPDFEEATASLLEALPQEAIDLVVSHAAPVEFATQLACPRHSTQDQTEQLLSEVLRRLKPKQWLFGHYHCYQKGVTAGCQWTALASVQSTQRYAAWI